MRARPPNLGRLCSIATELGACTQPSSADTLEDTRTLTQSRRNLQQAGVQSRGAGFRAKNSHLSKEDQQVGECCRSCSLVCAMLDVHVDITRLRNQWVADNDNQSSQIDAVNVLENIFTD